MNCNQLCPYNTLEGCKVEERNGVCPLINTNQLFGKSERLEPMEKGKRIRMKAYKCDSCGVTIEKPYTEKMKEFCLACEYDEHGIFPKFWKKK